jgi:hypothetical protein
MTTHTTIRSYPAIVGGTVAAGIAWATIVRDVGFAGITLDHIQAASLVGLTVLAGHLANQAWQELRLSAASGLAILAVLGSALTIYSAMGNRAEVRDVKVASASLSDSERARLQIDLDKTTKLVAEAETWTATECKSGRGPKCDGVTFILNQRRASQNALQGQLKQVGPVATPEPKAAQVALLAGLAGYDAGKTKQVVSAVEPLAFPLFLELLAIVLFGFGLGHNSVARFPTAKDTRQTSFFHEAPAIDCPTPPTNGGTRQSNVVQLHPVVEALQRAGNPVSNRDLAQLMQVSDGESSKRWQEVRDLLDIGRQGKELRISLKRTA